MRGQSPGSRPRTSCRERLARFESEGKLLEAQRLRMRTQYDLEMMRSSASATASRTTRPRSRGGRATPPNTLLDFFPRRLTRGARTSRRGRAPAPRASTRATGPARRTSSSTGSGCRRRRTTALRASRESSSRRSTIFLSATPATGSCPTRPRWSNRSCAPPASSTRRSSEAHQGPDRRPGRGHQRAGHPGRPDPGHHPHQEDGRGPTEYLPGAGRAGPVPPQRGRHHRAHRDPPPHLRSASSTSPSASTCCGRPGPARGLTGGHPRRGQEGFLRSETSLIQTIGRRPQRRRPGRDVCRPPSPTRCSGPSRRRTGAGASSRRTTRPTGSTPDHPQGGQRHPRPAPAERDCRRSWRRPPSSGASAPAPEFGLNRRRARRPSAPWREMHQASDRGAL